MNPEKFSSVQEKVKFNAIFWISFPSPNYSNRHYFENLEKVHLHDRSKNQMILLSFSSFCLSNTDFTKQK